MTRQEAFELIRSELGESNLLKHSLAVEACMKELARRLGYDEEKWALAGLLHDLDYDMTKDDLTGHGNVAAEILRDRGVDDEVVEAVRSHAGHTERTSPMAKALYAADPLTGLIVSSALMHPDRSLAGLDTPFILNRFKENRFAAGANRNQIKSCGEIGLDLADFIDICLGAMRRIASELGL